MALVHYTAKTVTSGGTSRTILSADGSSSKTVYVSPLIPTVTSGGEMLVLGTRINGGENGGEVNIINVSGGQIKTNVCFSVAAGDIIYLDNKECYTVGESLEIYSDQPDICVDVFAHSSTVNS